MDMTEYPNWFRQTAQPHFAHNLAMLEGQPELRFLQIGAFTGDATDWLLRNVLTGEGSTLFDVDPWQDYSGLDGYDMEDVFEQYKAKTDWSDKLVTNRETSREFFKNNGERFHFIYIDGAHDSVSVLEDAVNAYQCLVPFGILAFDDYTWSAETGDALDNPGPAIDAVRHLYRGKLVPIEVSNQVWMIKMKKKEG